MPGAVASAHPFSTAAGEEVLARGGNAYDATIAVSAALTVVQPHTNGLGADFFAVVHDHGFRSINGSGWAAGAASPETFRRQGLRSVPRSGPLSALTVPGLVAAWTLLLPRTSRPLRNLLAPAVRWARDGFPASASLARAVATTRRRADDDWRATYAGVRAGVRLRQPALARALAAVGRDGPEAFYHGALARRIARELRAKGTLLTERDLDDFRAEWTTPLRARYRNVDVYTTPPNSQGATALLWLRLLEPEALASASEPEFLATLVRTMRVAYRYRARYIGDPRYLPFPPELLDPASPLDAGPDDPGPRTLGAGDTTAFSVWDGTVGVSAIQSNYMGFGSGVSLPSTGINLNNRGSYFSLDPEHPNCLAPGKRTFHTLMSVIASAPGRDVLLGSMGGDVQPQVHVQVLTRIFDREATLRAAIAAPRFAYPATIYGDAELFAEPGLELPRARRIRGDRSMFGHAHGIDCGTSPEVGIDPRGDGARPVAFRAARPRRTRSGQR